MDQSPARILKLHLCRSLALVALLIAGAVPALSQAAPKPQTSPTPGPAEVHARVTESAIDSSIENDPAVDKMLSEYAPRVRELDVVIGHLKGELRKGGVGGGSLGNFVTDGILAEARQKLGKPIVLSVVNSGGLRKSTIAEGELRQRDIFELLPFENALVACEMSGAQVLSLLKVVLSHRDAQSGARIRYHVNADKKMELESARILIDGRETEIDPAASYMVVTIDYLLKRTGNSTSPTEGDYSVFNQAKNVTPLGITIRDAITHYVKAETAAGRDIKLNLDGRFSLNRAASANPEETRP